MDGSPKGAEWSLAVVDALISHELANAAEDGNDPLVCARALVQMVEERAMEWLPQLEAAAPADGMPADRDELQKMLNAAFNRGRDEVHAAYRLAPRGCGEGA